MLGQLHDAGNTTTLAHYLELLQGAGMIAGLQKYSGKKVKQRGSSPKLIALNTALMSAMSGLRFKEARMEKKLWGRQVETAVGAYLFNSIQGTNLNLYYWNAGNREVDFILTRGKKVVAIEVKSGRPESSLPCMEAFSSKFHVTRKLLVGSGGIPLEDFFVHDVKNYVT
jgi:predicted AAA+ superfamily ATPase